MLRTRVKICGITRVQDVEAACEAGADAIGLVFYPKSSRLVSLEQARSLRCAVPAFVSVTALFVNVPEAQVRQVLEQVRPDVLQFHGDETPEYCAGFGHAYMKAFRVGGPGLEDPQSVLEACRRYPHAAAWLFDSYSPGYGGSGLTFDIALLDEVRHAPDSRPLVLAGGLSPLNVAEAVKTVRPYALDVSSGVEESGGIKSAEKMQAFMQEVCRASFS
ncbi:phosphoribosylanthranilate isomerase [Pusillimonas caeni]|uniref:phosphoribosylanthranilate isomerase n=1 Tax=Pusillimonas caeni TaxID=1348472 RepID=UPI000E59D36C|nr:phosphoribosylanthranilate isomerase [Pusillimonas caeni]TFL11315.1 phosphoribosylanthranilate isomerase [Pusillimonas caeni]